MNIFICNINTKKIGISISDPPSKAKKVGRVGAENKMNLD